jgi:hypothetical protein
MAPIKDSQAAVADAREVERAVNEHSSWYHTLELAPGVITPGYVDTRDIASKILPDDLSGLRALDVGTFDGFWAFEMERRGAATVAIDVGSIDAAEWPPLNRERLLRSPCSNEPVRPCAQVVGC